MQKLRNGGLPSCHDDSSVNIIVRHISVICQTSGLAFCGMKSFAADGLSFILVLKAEAVVEGNQKLGNGQGLRVGVRK